MYLTPKYLAYK